MRERKQQPTTVWTPAAPVIASKVVIRAARAGELVAAAAPVDGEAPATATPTAA